MVKEAVDGRPGAAHVGPKGAVGEKLHDELPRARSRLGQVVARESREVPGPLAGPDRLDQRLPSLLETGGASQLVEPLVDVAGRGAGG